MIITAIIGPPVVSLPLSLTNGGPSLLDLITAPGVLNKFSASSPGVFSSRAGQGRHGAMRWLGASPAGPAYFLDHRPHRAALGLRRGAGRPRAEAPMKSQRSRIKNQK